MSSKRQKEISFYLHLKRGGGAGHLTRSCLTMKSSQKNLRSLCCCRLCLQPGTAAGVISFASLKRLVVNLTAWNELSAIPSFIRTPFLETCQWSQHLNSQGEAATRVPEEHGHSRTRGTWATCVLEEHWPHTFSSIIFLNHNKRQTKCRHRLPNALSHWCHVRSQAHLKCLTLSWAFPMRVSKSNAIGI